MPSTCSNNNNINIHKIYQVLCSLNGLFYALTLLEPSQQSYEADGFRRGEMVSQAHRRLPLQHKHFYFDVFSFSLASLVIKWFPRSLTFQTLINKKKKKKKTLFLKGATTNIFIRILKVVV